MAFPESDRRCDIVTNIRSFVAYVREVVKFRLCTRCQLDARELVIASRQTKGACNAKPINNLTQSINSVSESCSGNQTQKTLAPNSRTKVNPPVQPVTKESQPHFTPINATVLVGVKQKALVRQVVCRS